MPARPSDTQYQRQQQDMTYGTGDIAPPSPPPSYHSTADALIDDDVGPYNEQVSSHGVFGSRQPSYRALGNGDSANGHLSAARLPDQEREIPMSLLSPSAPASALPANSSSTYGTPWNPEAAGVRRYIVLRGGPDGTRLDEDDPDASSSQDQGSCMKDAGIRNALGACFASVVSGTVTAVGNMQ
jgi:hypothetical protein